jgi:hypothetical protein
MPVPHQDFEPRDDLETEKPSYTILATIWVASDDPDDPETIITIIRNISKCPHTNISSQMTRVICFPNSLLRA